MKLIVTLTNCSHEKTNLCYCILTVQYVKRYCVAGYLLVIIIIIICGKLVRKGGIAAHSLRGDPHKLLMYWPARLLPPEFHPDPVV